MNHVKKLFHACLFSIGLAGCTMSSASPKITPGDGYIALTLEQVSNEGLALRSAVETYLRDQYTIEDVQYYSVDASFPWNAISKNAQNKLTEQGMSSARPEWHRPGYDLVDIYADKRDGGIAVAALQNPLADGRKLVGFFTLKRRQ